ncbi:MAG: hypothetical protein MRQ11_02020 [Candidatus Midichloria mitochondrii]|nr:hypothetical protein [Candidatus Midichloria mitochondrii]MDJ1256182.1 hypothetical protein [Candidatus Midichloria mitochondrii]MDJ1287901.1 hypothetical protein [Candidatus Midichloria mitochondrii]MDJ1298705.1 hypothetical protein [Candidatus Midichloria mitochondrii]MDJ1312944.1 hypothetical protein [Candidatus Midichloria mitochondrii]MDJ1583466.1 hypothetical protein [Candidatus Midichloria mitochondrii]
MIKQIKINFIRVILMLGITTNCSYGLIPEDKIFTVNNIKAFSDFGTVAESKKIALDNATREAMLVLLNRITIEKQNGKFNSIVKNDNSSLVKKYVILNERITSHSYSAEVDVEFHPASVKALLNRQGLNFAEKIYNDCLIIPFYENFSSNLVLQWRQFLPEQFGLVEPVTLRSELDDLTSFNIRNIKNYEYKDFYYLLKKYHTKEVMLVQVSEIEENTEKVYVKIKFINSTNTYFKNLTFEKNMDEDEDDVHKRIINEVLLQLDSWWKGSKGIWN